MPHGSRMAKRTWTYCWESIARWIRGRSRNLFCLIIPADARASRQPCDGKRKIQSLHHRKKRPDHSWVADEIRFGGEDFIESWARIKGFSSTDEEKKPRIDHLATGGGTTSRRFGFSRNRLNSSSL